MDIYVNKIKASLNTTFENLLSEKKTLKLVNGSELASDRIGTVTISEFSELKLLSFTGERKFEVNGEGTFNIWEKAGTHEKTKYVAFQFKNAIVKFDDNTRNFEVLDAGTFTAFTLVK